jgi:hypothetical protein
MFTDRELEFIFSLRTSWPRLYSAELARLLKEGASYPNRSAGFCKQILPVVASEAKHPPSPEGGLRRKRELLVATE